MGERSTLSAVPSETPNPPYPPDTKANGWKPEVDWQRIKSSKTWRTCPHDQRNNLLRLWLESWNEVPAGSWEADDEIIAVAIDLPIRLFTAHRDHLMRGWYRCSDGRLYHPVIAEMVFAMTQKRMRNAQRVRKHRESKTDDVTHYSNAVTHYNDDVTCESHGSNAQEQEQEQDNINIAQMRKLTSTRFDDFWNVYPNRKDKKRAIDIWKRKRLDEQADDIIAKVAQQAANDRGWLDGYVPHPSTYLNGERWTDEIEAVKPKLNGYPPQSPQPKPSAAKAIDIRDLLS
jgi:hypothetical protein